jgi:AcrR family transcriptional regulator
VVTDRLSRAAHLTRATVAEHAVRLADTEGLDAVTIRRLAQELGVTPMALYWHFKNKDELLLGIADHVMSGVQATRKPGDSWTRQLRAMVESLVAVMRAHPSLPALLQNVDKQSAVGFARATNDALALLTGAGFTLQESYWIASYLLHSSIGLVAAWPGCPATVPEPEAAEWRRQKRLTLEKLTPGDYPMIAAFARTVEDETDTETYYSFGIDLVMAGVTAIADRRTGKPDPEQA